MQEAQEAHLQPKVIGIDPSLTGTAAVIYYADGMHDAKRFPSKPLGKDVRNRNQRYLDIIRRLFEFLGDEDPLVICVEGYSYGSIGQQNYLGEFGGLLRSDLCVYETAKIFEVAPGTLKKFITGKGNADKVAIVTKTLQQWDAGFSTDDEFDAYGLARIAACIAGLEAPAKQTQADSLKAITGNIYEVSKVTKPNTTPTFTGF